MRSRECRIFFVSDRQFYVDVYPEFPEIRMVCLRLFSGLETVILLGFPEFPEVAASRAGDLFGIVKG